MSILVYPRPGNALYSFKTGKWWFVHSVNNNYVRLITSAEFELWRHRFFFKPTETITKEILNLPEYVIGGRWIQFDPSDMTDDWALYKDFNKKELITGFDPQTLW